MKKVYLILGASADIGMAFIRSAAEKDADAVFYAHYRTMNDKLHTLQKNLAGRCHLLQADLSKAEEVTALIRKIAEAPTHILHLPASRIQYMRFRQINAEDLKREMQIEVYSLLNILQTFLPQMAKAKCGRVVAVATSCTVGIPPKFLGAYTIAKYALLGLIKSAAAEYVEKGIHINALSPNMVETKFLAHVDSRVVEMTAQERLQGRNLSLREVVTGINYLFDEDNPMCGGNLVV